MSQRLNIVTITLRRQAWRGGYRPGFCVSMWTMRQACADQQAIKLRQLAVLAAVCLANMTRRARHKLAEPGTVWRGVAPLI